MRLFAVSLAIGASFAGCTTLHLPAPGSAKYSFASTAAVVSIGVGRANLTLPPGVAMFGHGPEARIVDGLWTRLYCRAFVFTQGDAALAIVPCDLPAVGTLLQRHVAAVVARELHGDKLPAPRIMLSATHTHAGPGHFLETPGYADLGSTYGPGYDDSVTKQLSESMGAAIADAYRNAQPAVVRWSHGNALWHLTRNRSVTAYLRDASPYAVAPPADVTLPEERAIDPAVDVLEIERTDECHTPIGSLSFVAMHPTVMPATQQLMNADVFGVTSRVLESGLRKRAEKCGTHGDPLAGIVNTNEGDMSPSWTVASVEETLNIGERLADAVRGVLPSEDAPRAGFESPLVASAYVEFEMGVDGSAIGLPAVCPSGEIGFTAASGASDHRTFLVLAHPDDWDPLDLSRTDCQKPKRAFPWFSFGKARGDNLPSLMPIAVTRIGDVAITFVPVEMTITAGHRVDEAVVSALGVQRAIIGGLTNGYMQYVATAEEYDLQRYEGASTLFGPGSAARIREVARRLARHLAGEELPLPATIDEARASNYELGPERKRLPDGTGEPTNAELASKRQTEWLCTLPKAIPPVFCFAWHDAAPGVVPLTSEPWLSLAADDATKAAQAKHLLDDRGAFDDRGTGFRTRIDARAGDAWRWLTLYRPTRDEWQRWAGDVGAARIEVRSADGQPGLRSDPLDESRLPICSPEQQRACGLP
ncbi:MAG: neutral/alkaline non-lysosomal ceramidase N-terminal domain-containing protein [Polyangiales bacterium]